MQFEEKVYDLLLALGIYKSDLRYFGGYGGLDWDAERQQREDSKLELMRFAKDNLEEVINTIHSWSRDNSQYNARIDQGTQELILVHDLIQAAKNTKLALK